MPPVKHIGIVLEVAVVVALLLAGAFAVPIVYTFNLTFTSSPLTPRVVQGSVSVYRDDCSPLCDGVFAPAGGTSNNNLLSIDVTVDAEHSRAQNYNFYLSFVYPSFPEVTLYKINHPSPPLVT